MQMLQQFNKFVNDMKGKNAKQIVLDLMNSGKMNNTQFNQFMQQAKQLEPLLKSALK